MCVRPSIRQAASKRNWEVMSHDCEDTFFVFLRQNPSGCWIYRGDHFPIHWLNLKSMKTTSLKQNLPPLSVLYILCVLTLTLCGWDLFCWWCASPFKETYVTGSVSPNDELRNQLNRAVDRIRSHVRTLFLVGKKQRKSFLLFVIQILFPFFPVFYDFDLKIQKLYSVFFSHDSFWRLLVSHAENFHIWSC